MTGETVAALVFAALAAPPFAAQVGLALGAPWGAVTLAGRWPGKLPPRMRIAALAQAAVLLSLAAIALDHGGVIALGLPVGAIWIVVAVSGISAVLNTITPSRIERLLWSPVTILMACAALFLAIA